VDRVLIIDDDVELGELLTEYLRPEGFQVEAVADGWLGLDQASRETYDLVVLDVMMPGISSLEVLRSLRRWSPVPVLMLTARGEDVDRIVGLELGADDYLPKPFNPRELLARVRAILRRVKQQVSEVKGQAPYVPGRLTVGEVVLDPGTRSVICRGNPVEVTTVEFSLLEVLMMSASRAVTREHLIRKVLGRAFDPYDRSIDVHISNIRKKLGHKVGEAERIKAIRGVGYLYARTAEAVGEVIDEP
jgi:two-component system, OmpR family, response regulator CpxR